MKQTQINSLLNSFFISHEELERREALQEFANSVSDIIVSEFANNYLLNNPYLSVYLSHTDGNMLLKKIKVFVAFVLTAPVNETYVNRIHEIGILHYSIKLEPAKVSYGFWAINEVLNKLADTNPLVKEYRSFISKLLKFVEHLMNDGYYISQKKQELNASNTLQGINAQNELYIGLNIHKLNAKKVSLAIADSTNIHLLEDINEDEKLCSFGKILQGLKGDKQYEYILGTSSDEVDTIHAQWHQEFRDIKSSIASNDTSQLQIHNKKINSLTQELSSILDNSLQNSLQDGQFSLKAGIKAMQKMTDLFYNKDYNSVGTNDIQESIYNALNSAILSEFSWAIQDISIHTKTPDAADHILKQIRYGSTNFFILIEIKQAQNTSYINEIIHLLLEVLELHFYVQEREISLVRFADEAEGANKSKDMFLANMSHELRTPINAITGFSQILMMKKDTPDTVKKYVEKINIAGNNLLDLVNTILDFAKLESGKMQFTPSLSNISNVLREVQTLVGPLAEKKNIQLHMPNIVSLNLYIDNTLFKQVLINLLTNAIKFTHKEGNIDLNIEYNESKHVYTFQIKDNGIGISKENIDKLFQSFSQIDNAYQKEHKGSGLGLMICKSIVEELHKGKIWAESVEGQGSSFFIDMPTPMIESHTYTVDKAPKNALHALIVEDSPEYQNILIDNLQNTHTLTITDTINKAKELITKNNYDFLILDFFLTDGISSEILQYMEEEGIDIPSIIISAEDEIHISSSLSGSSNLECIINKKNIQEICASIRGKSTHE